MKREDETRKDRVHAASAKPAHRRGRTRRRGFAVGAAAIALAALLAVPSVAVAQGMSLPEPLQGIASFFGLGEAASPRAVEGQETIVDNPSVGTWGDWELNDTANVGRIWTDKTVLNDDITFYNTQDEPTFTVNKAEGSDFLTVLSALASSSNISSTIETPLDIVLVLDASGSMDDPMGTSYTPVYDISTSSSYYVLVDGSYTQVSYDSQNGWQYGNRRKTTVTPKTSADDTDSSHVQFYSGSTDNTKRIDALSEAASSFVDAIARQNANISDVTKQHQISIVKFSGDKTDRVGNSTYNSGVYTYNYSQVMRSMGACTTGSVATSIKSTIKSITPAGATRADYGLELAQAQTSGREDAKKVVIFFTDGSPTAMSGFSPSVANSAVDTAKEMKDAGTVIYSIGVMAGANPQDTSSQDNSFMHAVSSNYPSATAYNTLGDRAANSDFYKSATNAEELHQLFAELAETLTAGSGLPTSTTEGAESTSGYVTFDDQLGDYMEVDEFGPILFASQIFGDPTVTTETTDTGEVLTYTFSGTAGNVLYPEGNLSNIIIQVTKSNDAATGDHVLVKIPAALIPLRHFNVDETEGTMSVSDTYPIRLFYSSGLKDEAASGLANPDAALADYISKNKNRDADGNEDGKVAFYANGWGEYAYGDTIASFDPAKNNSYYYFTRDMPIYTDEACTVRAASIEPGETYYYKQGYYERGADGSAIGKTEYYHFLGSDALAIVTDLGHDDAGYFFKAGTPRLSYIGELHTAKNPNITQTGRDIINPVWNNLTTIDQAQTVYTHLGNNGKLLVDVPGTLAVSKTIELPQGYELTDALKNASFEFSVSIPNAAGKTLSAEVKDAEGVVQGSAFDLTFDAQGKATHSIKHGETLYIYGLVSGDTYTVTENAPLAGFKQTSPVDDSGAAAAAEGTIAAGATAQASFTNSYAAQGTLEGATNLVGEKVFKGRDWREGDTFTFGITALTPGAPMPADYLVTVGKSDVASSDASRDASNAADDEPEDGQVLTTTAPFNFGDITYTTPGEYRYEIVEMGNNPIAGVDYSQAKYNVVVTVTDNGTGTLQVESQMTLVANDAGVRVAATPATSAVFTNVFDAADATWNPGGQKIYVDKSGEKPLAEGMFHFRLSGEPGAPMPAASGAVAVNEDSIVATTNNPAVIFNAITFESSLIGDTYTYTVVEVVQNDAGEWVSVKDGITPTLIDGAEVYVKDGMTYDPSVWTIEVTVTDEVIGGQAAVKVVPVYKKDGVVQSGVTGFEFTNVYEPEAVTLEGDAFVAGTKTLTGRNMLGGETFGFTLAAANTATASAIANGSVTLSSTGAAQVSGGADGQAVPFNFGDATFTKPGTYTFTVAESAWNDAALPADAPAAAAKGVTFDRHTCTVTITVVDNDGVLSADVAYSDSAEGAVFNNSYVASGVEYDTAELDLEKVFSGRDWTANDSFTFDSSRVSYNGSTDSAMLAYMPLPTTPITVTGTAADGSLRHDGDSVPFNFGKLVFSKPGVYVYRVTELGGGQVSNGITYSDNVATVTITVTDNVAEGKLEASAAITSGSKTFNNTYTSTMPENEKIKTNFRFNKILAGREWLDTDEFTFDLTADDGAPLPAATTATVTKGSVNGSFSFGQIEYTYDMVKNEPNHEKTFVYHVSERAGSIAGITYSDKVATVKVTVRDDGQGNLLATIALDAGSVWVFTNTYTSTLDYAAAGGLNITKTLTGHAMADNQFSFAVTPVATDTATAAEAAEKLGLSEGENTLSVPGAADGAVSAVSVVAAGAGQFTQADAGKTYTYTIVENRPAEATAQNGYTAGGYTYDSSEYTVTITTVDNVEDATLTVTTTVVKDGETVGAYTYTTGEVASSSAVVPFANSYAAQGTLIGSTNLTGMKLFSGRAWNASDSFTFSLAAESSADAPLPAQTQVTVSKDDANADGKAAFNFGDITYTAPGEYTYTISEVVPEAGIAGVTYSQAVYRVTVTAEDNNDGTLDVSSVMTPVKNDAGEVVEGATTVGLAQFTNSFSADATSWAPSGKKVYTDNSGANPLVANMFSFRLTALNGAPMPEAATGATLEASNHDAQATETSSAVFEGNVSFGNIAFTADMVGNTYQYTISEIIPAGANAENGYTVGGMTYDPSEWEVSVSVGSETVSGKEVVKLDVSYKKDGQAVAGATGFEFANEYTPSSVTVPAEEFVQGSKTLDGRDMLANETFGFTLAPAAAELDGGVTAAAVADGSVALGGTTAQVSGAADGVAAGFTFGDATFTKPGTYTFTVVESAWNGNAIPASSINGITFDRSAWTVTVVINDNDGVLECGSVTYVNGETEGTEAAFVNRYATGDVIFNTVNVPLKKLIDGRDWLASDSFTFKIEAVTANAPMPKNAAGEDVSEVEVTQANKDAVSFGTITYTFADVAAEANNTKTFMYKVTEVVPSQTAAGMTYDSKTIYLDVTVADNGDGTLSATAAVRDDNGIAGDDDTFANVYYSGLDYVAAGGLRITKTLTGHAMDMGQFSFTVTPVATDTVTAAEAAAKLGLAQGANSLSVPGAAEGAVSAVDVVAAGAGQFTQADAGKTYAYKIVEVNAGAKGYTYDTAERTVTITVSDDPANAKLTVTTTVTGGSDEAQVFVYETGAQVTEENKATVPFNNSYFASTDEPGGAKASVVATKTLTGRPLADGEFSFALKYAGAAAEVAPVATATNTAAGVVDFGSLSYNTNTLAALVADGYATKGVNADGKTTWTIQYTAYENTTGLSSKGITPTKSSFDFVITVVDNNDGTLTASAATTDAAGFAFTNEYGTSNQQVALNGSKVLSSEGFTPNDITGKFTFTVAVKTQGAPLPEATTAKNDAAGNVSFGNITFTLDALNAALAGSTSSDRSFVFSYEITETGTVEGVTNDATAKTVSFKVTDNGDGTLTVERISAGDTAFVFINTYEPASASISINGTKTLTGRDMKDGETFGFTLAAADDATKAALTDGSVSLGALSFTATAQGGTDGAAVPFSFGTASFNKPGTYQFAIQETSWNGQAISNIANKQGLTFDGHTCTVTVVVTDDGAGVLVPEIAYSDAAAAAGDETGAVFNNQYFAEMPDNEKVKTSASFTKVLEGRDWLESDSFTFKLEAIDGAPLPQDEEGNVVDEIVVNEDNAANFTFGEITYTFDMVKNEVGRSKTFQYKVKEVAGSIPGIEYATNEALLSITVRDNTEGQLVASVELANATFTNKYSSGLSYTAAGGLKLTKVLDGRDMADGQFKFEVTPVATDTATAAEAAAKLGFAEGENEFSAPAAFDGQVATIDLLAGKNVSFTQADAGKTYVYKVSEVNDGVKGYTYDTAERTVTITTADDPANAKLTVTTTVTGGLVSPQVFTYVTGEAAAASAIVPFNNSYFASIDEPGGTSAEVEATKELTGRPLENGEFSFGVKYANAADDEADVDAAVNAADGKVVFSEFGHYTTATLKDLVSAGHAVKGVSDDGKVMWTINYIAYEKTDGLADEGVSATRPAFNFTVTVLDNNDGTLTATAQANDEKGYLFQNVYSTGDPIEIELAGRKVLELTQEGLTPNDITGKFTFTLEPVTEDAPMPEVDTATNDSNGAVSFGNIVFTLEDLNSALERQAKQAVVAASAPAAQEASGNVDDAEGDKGAASVDSNNASAEGLEQAGSKDAGNGYQAAGQGALGELGIGGEAAAAVSDEAADEAGVKATAAAGDYSPYAGVPRSFDFVYKVTESGTVDGVTNDATATKNITFRVTDDGRGHLTVQPLFDDGVAFTFTNSYGVEPETSSVTDSLSVVKTLTGRDMTEGEFTFELVEDGNVVATAANGKDGSVAFSPITYEAPGVHHYTIREVKAGLTEAGVTYDGTTFAVKTVVSDNGDGTLSVEHAFEGDFQRAEFVNVYKPTSTSVALGTAKVLAGKLLEDGQFTFRLTSSDGSVLEAKNTASGQVLFPVVTFDKVGVYEYAISEVNDGQANITYDTSVHNVTVTVTDDLKGNLVASVAYADGATPVFKNTYTPPAPKTNLSKTGDDLGGLMGVAAAVAVVAAGAARVAYKRSRKHEEK